MDNDEAYWRSRRQHFRIYYPSSDYPKIDIWGGEYDVVDVSEKGTKFLYTGKRDVMPEEKISARIIFGNRGDAVDVAGKVLKIEEQDINRFKITGRTITEIKNKVKVPPCYEITDKIIEDVKWGVSSDKLAGLRALRNNKFSEKDFVEHLKNMNLETSEVILIKNSAKIDFSSGSAVILKTMPTIIISRLLAHLMNKKYSKDLLKKHLGEVGFDKYDVEIILDYIEEEVVNEPKRVILYFSERGIPFKKMLDEQRYIISKYPHLKPK